MLHKAQLYYQYAENAIISLKQCKKTLKDQIAANWKHKIPCKTGAKHLTIKESPISVQ